MNKNSMTPRREKSTKGLINMANKEFDVKSTIEELVPKQTPKGERESTTTGVQIQNTVYMRLKTLKDKKKISISKFATAVLDNALSQAGY